MKRQELVATLKSSPESATFSDVISTIESEYRYTPCRIRQAMIMRISARLFAMAKQV